MWWQKKKNGKSSLAVQDLLWCCQPFYTAYFLMIIGGAHCKKGLVASIY